MTRSLAPLGALALLLASPDAAAQDSDASAPAPLPPAEPAAQPPVDAATGQAPDSPPANPPAPSPPPLVAAPPTPPAPSPPVAAPPSAASPLPLQVSRAAPPQDLHALGYLGGFGDDEAGGITAGASVRYRAGPLVGGALLEGGGELLGYSYAGAAVQLGLALRESQNVRVELLGSFGAHWYSGVGRDWLFGSDPGANGSTTYAGARATIGYLFGRGTGHFELGAYGDFQDDLTRQRVRYTYPATGTGWFDGGGEGDHVVGTSRIGFGLELGGTHDFL